MNKIALSAALILATASTAFAENNAIPGERNPHPIAVQQSGVSVYEGRAQLVAPQYEMPGYAAEAWGPRSTSSIYGGGF